MQQRFLRNSAEAVFAKAPKWLRTTGVYGWLFAGTLVFVGAILWLIGYASGLTVPLIVAAVMAALFAPLVGRLTATGIPRPLGAAIVLLLLFAIVVFTIWLVVTGVISQAGLIAKEVTAGVRALSAWAAELDLPEGILARTVEESQAAIGRAASSAVSIVSTGLSGTVALIFGAFLGAFMLYFILRDWDAVSEWVGSHLGVPTELGSGLVEDAVGAMREYFETLTISAVVVGLIVGAAMWVLDLPLAIPVGIVTFLTCYIPFLGAIVSGIFAVLIALGAGGVSAAIIILVVILITQNVIQSIILNALASERLDIHPLGLLIATLLGGITGGILGAALGPALLAFVLRAVKRLNQTREELDAGDLGNAHVAETG